MPRRVRLQFIANVGSNNPLYMVRTDLFNFNGTIYNFEPDATCRDKGDSRDNEKDNNDNNKDGNKLKPCKDQDSGNNDNSDNNDTGDNQNKD